MNLDEPFFLGVFAGSGRLSRSVERRSEGKIKVIRIEIRDSASDDILKEECWIRLQNLVNPGYCIGIWTAKKRYILNVFNEEGVDLKEPKLKIMGIEAVKSSTPAPCRIKIKEALKVIMNKDENALIQFIDEFRTHFKKLRPEEIAYPRSCNNLKKYSSSTDIYQKSTPIHVKGALLYNNLLKKNKLRKYERIQEGDKIKFIVLKEPNPLRERVISFPTYLPEEFKLHQYINYDEQFDKSFLEPLRFIVNAINWNFEKKATLDSFF